MTPEEIEAKKAEQMKLYLKRTREHLRDAAEQYVVERCPDWVAYGLDIEPGDEDLAEETRRFREHILGIVTEDLNNNGPIHNALCRRFTPKR